MGLEQIQTCNRFLQVSIKLILGLEIEMDKRFKGIHSALPCCKKVRAGVALLFFEKGIEIIPTDNEDPTPLYLNAMWARKTTSQPLINEG